MDDALVVSEDPETVTEIFLAEGQEHEAVLDGGAQSFAAGENTVRRYSEYLPSRRIKWTPREIKCSRLFRFGNDQVLECTKGTIIPVNLAGRTGALHVHVIPGSTPFLFPARSWKSSAWSLTSVVKG